MLRIIDQGIITRESGRGAYMPVIVPLSGGTLISAQHGGTELGSPDNRIELHRSEDQGQSWEPLGKNLHELQPPGWAYRGPDVAEVSPGKLIMTATRFESADGQLFDAASEGLKRPEMLFYRSDDNGAHWSGPQIVDVDLDPSRYTWNGAGRFLMTAVDRWLFPLETWKPEGYNGPPDQKAAFVVSKDQGKTWGDFTVVADDLSGAILYWDQMGCLLPDGRIYVMFWTHKNGTNDDLPVHWSVSEDHGRTWTAPRPTNLPGQVCSPIPLADGRVAAIYNHRRQPHGIRVAVSKDLEHFDRSQEVVVFDAGAEAMLGTPESDAFFDHHQKIGFGKPAGHLADDGSVWTYFWCTTQGVTHTRWVRLQVDA